VQISLNSVGIGQPNVNGTTLAELKIPIPPYQEQLRIVEEVKKWLFVTDGLDVEIGNLQAFITGIKAKILDLAIHGKLVSQDPNDEPAIDLLKRINPDFEPCDTSHYENMPLNWCSCTLKDIFEITMGSSPKGSTLNQDNDGVEFHQGKICFTDKYLAKSATHTNSPIKFGKANSILLCVRAPVGVVNITPRQICIGRGLCALYPKQNIDLMFIFYALQTYQERFNDKATGTTFKAIGGDTIRNEIFFLPPYKEQIRIRERLEIIFSNLDAISAGL
jgi:type I restriction enzyme S subunit